MKNFLNKTFVVAVVLLLVCTFAIRASERDITVKFMLDTSSAMKAQDIVLSTSAILAAEISDFAKNNLRFSKNSSIRILVDSFWQKDNLLQSQGIFDYRLGQIGTPSCDGLRDLKTKWFVDDETALNKLVNRNWPAKNKDTVWVILTNSQETLTNDEISEINRDAKKVNSKLIIVMLPRKNNYNDVALKAEIAKRVHGAFEDIQAYIHSLQFNMTLEVVVNGKKVDLSKDITVVAPANINMRVLISGEDRFFWQYRGIEKTEKSISLKNEEPGDFSVSAIGIDYMGNEHVQDIKFHILPEPKAVANFSFFPVSGLAPLKVSITNKSINAQKYQWNWGDGTPESTEVEPSHTYGKPGEYVITLNILGKNGDVVSKKAKINVAYPAPVAKFTAPASVSADAVVEFVNDSQNATRWLWDFGDGCVASTEKNPKHRFTKIGSYNVSLKVFNPSGLASQTMNTIKVNEKLSADFEWNPLSPATHRIVFKNRSTGAVKYNWDFGDGATSSEFSPTHSFETKETKTYHVSLTAVSADGQESVQTESIEITVKHEDVQAVRADFSWQQISASVPTFKFTNNSKGAEEYLWSFGDNMTSTDREPSHAYKVSKPKLVNVSLTATASNGSSDKKTVSIEIHPEASGLPAGVIWVIALIIIAAVVFAIIKFFRKDKAFSVTLYSTENKAIGRRVVKVGEIVSITSLNAGNDLDFQIVKAEDDDGDDFKVRFRKPEESPSVLKQKTLKIHLSEQWSDPIDMSNLSVDSGRLDFFEGENEEDEGEEK